MNIGKIIQNMHQHSETKTMKLHNFFEAIVNISNQQLSKITLFTKKQMVVTESTFSKMLMHISTNLKPHLTGHIFSSLTIPLVFLGYLPLHQSYILLLVFPCSCFMNKVLPTLRSWICLHSYLHTHDASHHSQH